MTICTDHKDEVCYESRNCPACEIQAELDAAMERITKLENEIEELNASE